jgi:cytochrome bd-type quinol oxidase subunit 2
MLLNKVDIRPILSAHFATLRDNRVIGKQSWQDGGLFFGIPTLFGIGLTWYGFRFRVDAVNGFLNVFAILTGLLLNLLVLVFTLSTTAAPTDVEKNKRRALLKEVFANLCFAVLVSIVVVCVAVVALSYMRSQPGATTGMGATFFLISLTANFILTLLMVMKRMFILLNKEVGNDTASRAA